MKEKNILIYGLTLAFIIGGGQRFWPNHHAFNGGRGLTFQEHDVRDWNNAVQASGGSALCYAGSADFLGAFLVTRVPVTACLPGMLGRSLFGDRNRAGRNTQRGARKAMHLWVYSYFDGNLYHCQGGISEGCPPGAVKGRRKMGNGRSTSSDPARLRAWASMGDARYNEEQGAIHGRSRTVNSLDLTLAAKYLVE